MNARTVSGNGCAAIGTFFAIRERGTRKYLPENYGRGYTHTEPCAGPQPRLFHSEHAAKNALTAWLKGYAKSITDTDKDDFGRPYTYQKGVGYDPVEGRNRDRMEIVRLSLVEAA